MRREKSLRLAGRFEPLHLPLASSRRLVRILRSVVEMLWAGRTDMTLSLLESL
jgi:hypothetical protein